MQATSWSQDTNRLVVSYELNQTIAASDLDVLLSPRFLRVSVVSAGKLVLAVDLHDYIDMDGSSWTLTGRVLKFSLLKATPQAEWPGFEVDRLSVSRVERERIRLRSIESASVNQKARAVTSTMSRKAAVQTNDAQAWSITKSAAERSDHETRTLLQQAREKASTEVERAMPSASIPSALAPGLSSDQVVVDGPTHVKEITVSLLRRNPLGSDGDSSTDQLLKRPVVPTDVSAMMSIGPTAGVESSSCLRALFGEGRLDDIIDRDIPPTIESMDACKAVLNVSLAHYYQGDFSKCKSLCSQVYDFCARQPPAYAVLQLLVTSVIRQAFCAICAGDAQEGAHFMATASRIMTTRSEWFRDLIPKVERDQQLLQKLCDVWENKQKADELLLRGDRDGALAIYKTIRDTAGWTIPTLSVNSAICSRHEKSACTDFATEAHTLMQRVNMFSEPFDSTLIAREIEAFTYGFSIDSELSKRISEDTNSKLSTGNQEWIAKCDGLSDLSTLSDMGPEFEWVKDRNVSSSDTYVCVRRDLPKKLVEAITELSMECSAEKLRMGAAKLTEDFPKYLVAQQVASKALRFADAIEKMWGRVLLSQESASCGMWSGFVPKTEEGMRLLRVHERLEKSISHLRNEFSQT